MIVDGRRWTVFAFVGVEGGWLSPITASVSTQTDGHAFGMEEAVRYELRIDPTTMVASFLSIVFLYFYISVDSCESPRAASFQKSVV